MAFGEGFGHGDGGGVHPILDRLGGRARDGANRATDRAERRAEHGRYQAASTAASDEDDDGDEAPLAATGAWNRMEALLCVHVFVPDSRAPVKVSPTDGLHDCY
jgi:hypothetical protein